MKSFRGIALGMAVLALVVVFVAPAWADPVTATPKTVGDFLAAYARVLNIELPADAGTDAVIATLRASGVRLDGKIDPAKPLTQGDVVKIGTENGVRVTSRNPVKPFTTEEIDQFFISYGPTLAHANEATSRTAAVSTGDKGGRYDAREHHRNNKGKGKMKGKGHLSPDEPDDHDNGDNFPPPGGGGGNGNGP